MLRTIGVEQPTNEKTARHAFGQPSIFQTLMAYNAANTSDFWTIHEGQAAYCVGTERFAGLFYNALMDIPNNTV